MSLAINKVLTILLLCVFPVRAVTSSHWSPIETDGTGFTLWVFTSISRLWHGGRLAYPVFISFLFGTGSHINKKICMPTQSGSL